QRPDHFPGLISQFMTTHHERTNDRSTLRTRSRPGLAEAVAKLQAAGTARVYMATVTGSQRRFILFLSEDLTQCVACW
ncbi:hypothetical protein ACIQF5_14270, partial [Streptomyces goshikiensis]|uniref:hypothetical protein n=1 Tax=Streptomyces goshikiensis TaxID=1942 RepID=UPI003820D376